jgi:hypothetical protein
VLLFCESMRGGDWEESGMDGIIMVWGMFTFCAELAVEARVEVKVSMGLETTIS